MLALTFRWAGSAPLLRRGDDSENEDRDRLNAARTGEIACGTDVASGMRNTRAWIVVDAETIGNNHNNNSTIICEAGAKTVFITV